MPPNETIIRDQRRLIDSFRLVSDSTAVNDISTDTDLIEQEFRQCLDLPPGPVLRLRCCS